MGKMCMRKMKCLQSRQFCHTAVKSHWGGGGGGTGGKKKIAQKI